MEEPDKVAKKSKISQLCSACYVFLGLTFAFVVVYIIWRQLKSSEPHITPPPHVDPEVLDSNNFCPFWEITNDGYCDDEANIEECNYDFGDCCDFMQNDFSLCQDCFCYSEEINDGCQLNFFDSLVLGDGDCHLDFNNLEHFFDLGDCCLQSSTLGQKYDFSQNSLFQN